MNNMKNTWDEWYNLLINYYNHYGNIDIKQNFKTLDGINYNESGYSLGTWLGNQRLLNNLEEEKRNKLLKLGLKFEKKYNRVKLTWEEWYKLAYNYYIKNNNLEVPNNYITNDGYKLGLWISNQRRRKDKLTIEEITKLKKIGMRFEKYKIDINWDEFFSIAKKYYINNNNLNIPSTYITEDGHKLGSWIARQRYNKNNLTKAKKELLLSIGMDFNNQKNTLSWDEWYSLALNYYNHYGNLKVLSKFITTNGINYNKSGYNLGEWISKQRKLYNKLNQNRIILLNNIGMIWDIRKNKEQLIQLCKTYNIDINKNKSILKKSYNEVYVKICFLSDLKNPITNNKGILNSIFFISNSELINIYNIDLKYLLNTYLPNNKKGK